MGLGRVERRVNTAEDDVRAARTREPSDFVTTQRIPGMDSDADDIAWGHVCGVEGIERFISDDRLAAS
jgi:hypothetical protein